MLFWTLTLSWYPSWPCCRGPSCSTSRGTPSPPPQLSRMITFSHLELICGVKKNEKHRILQPVVVGHVLLELVHLVAQQGCVWDPKCGTEIKSQYLTSIQWCWSQVSQRPYVEFIFVRKMLRSGRFRVSSTRPGEEKKWFNLIEPKFGHVLTYL